MNYTYETVECMENMQQTKLLVNVICSFPLEPVLMTELQEILPETIVPAELILAKHRKGSLATIDLMFEMNIGAFKSVLKDFNKDKE